LRLHKRLAVRKVKGNRGRSQPAIVTRLLRNSAKRIRVARAGGRGRSSRFRDNRFYSWEKGFRLTDDMTLR
jgi:hypothetical protein